MNVSGVSDVAQQPKSGWYSVMCDVGNWVTRRGGSREVTNRTQVTQKALEIKEESLEAQLRTQAETPHVSIRERAVTETSDPRARELFSEGTGVGNADEASGVLGQKTVTVRLTQDLQRKESIKKAARYDTMAIEHGGLTSTEVTPMAAQQPKTEGKGLLSRMVESVFGSGETVASTHSTKVEEDISAFENITPDKDRTYLGEEFVRGLSEEAIDASQDDWNTFFDQIGKDIGKRLSPLERERFEEELQNCRDNPYEFFRQASDPDNHLYYMVKDICQYNEVAFEAWLNIRDASSQYFYNLIDDAFSKDPEYQKAVQEWDSLEKKAALIYKKYEARDDDITGHQRVQELYGKQMDELGKKLYAYQKAYFVDVFKLLNETDLEYTRAANIIKQKMGNHAHVSGGNISDAENQAFLYLNDREFREAFDIIQNKYQAMANMVGFHTAEYDKLNVDPMELAGKMAREGLGDAAQYIKDHPGRFILSPAVVVASVYVGPTVAVGAAVGSVAAYHLGKKAIDKMEKAGIFYDVQSAKIDREIRSPFIQRIFSENLPDRLRLDHLSVLHENGLLYQQDLVMLDPKIRDAFLKQTGIEAKDLKNLDEIKSQRTRYLNVLYDVKSNRAALLDAFLKMAEQGILYQEDFHDFSKTLGLTGIDDTLKQEFLLKAANVGIAWDDIPAQKEVRSFRVRYLNVACSPEVTNEERLQYLQDLHTKKLLFRQDVMRIKDLQLKDDLLQGIGVSIEELPDMETHYTKDEREVRQRDDKIRKPHLTQLKSQEVVAEVKIEALKELNRLGLLFQQDLVGLDPAVKKTFLEITGIKEESLYDNDTFYEYGTSKRLIKLGEITFNAIKESAYENYQGGIYHVAHGALKGVKGLIGLSAEVADKTFGTFTDIETTALEDRVARVMPTDRKLKQQAKYVVNKSVGVVGWGIAGAAIAGYIGGYFGLALPAAKLGGIIGGAYGGLTTDGNVRQIPAGGFIRAIKFSGVGALVGAAVPMVAGAVIYGLAFAGVIGLSTAIAVSTMGLGLIIPCIVLGLFAGWKIAGLTGKDLFEKEEEDKLIDDIRFTPSDFETGLYANLEPQIA